MLGWWVVFRPSGPRAQLHSINRRNNGTAKRIPRGQLWYHRHVPPHRVSGASEWRSRVQYNTVSFERLINKLFRIAECEGGAKLFGNSTMFAWLTVPRNSRSKNLRTVNIELRRKLEFVSRHWTSVLSLIGRAATPWNRLERFYWLTSVSSGLPCQFSTD